MLEILAIKALDIDFINNLLQTNQTSLSLQEYRKQAEQDINLQAIDNKLLKYQDRLVVAKDNNLQTRLIRKAYAQVSTAHPRQGKTCKILLNRYYQPRITTILNTMFVTATTAAN